MQSHIALQLVSAVVETITLNRLPHFCSWPIQYALANLITLPEGYILRQSFSSYLLHIEWYEYLLDADIFIPYTRAEPSIFMFLMFEGHSALYKPPEYLISESRGGAWHMGYINKGSYKAKIKAGRTRLLLLTLRPEWLMRKAERLEKFKLITDQFLAAEQPVFSLPHCPVNQETIKQVKKMLLHDGINREHLDITIDSVLTQLSIQYHGMVVDGKYTTETLHRILAKKIASFIIAHYAEQIVENIPGLADQFNVSERQLLRLVKIAFDMPLHEYLVTLRMNKALVLLLTATQSIKEVAATVGYTNPHYFSTAFKKFHGISPNEVHGLCL